MISSGHDKDPIVQAIAKAVGLPVEEIAGITLEINTQDVTKLTIRRFVLNTEAEEIATAIETFELHRRDPE